MNPHAHIWVPTSGTSQRCTSCEAVESRPSGPVTIEELGILPGDPDTVGDNGGIVDYNVNTGYVQMGNGNSVHITDLIQANPRVDQTALRISLVSVHEKKVWDEINEIKAEKEAMEGGLRKMWTEAAKSADGLSALEKAMLTMTDSFPKKIQPTWNKANVLEYIAKEIRDSADPYKAAGEWITTVTNSISELTRNLDDDDD